ncbi:MAG: ParB/RepB/Spo0J family partition protein, partial [Alistipes sp.]|nr:ParB/RepB/Spo0J family partition protein [Alistipes sp.]
RNLIIRGSRRWRAAQRAGLESLPAYIREVDDQNLHAMALVENIQREDLNAIEIALGMQRLLEECGLTQEALSEKVGKKRSTVSNYMRLLRLPDQVQLALKEGLISMGHAKAIAGAPEEQQLRLLKRCVHRDLSVRQTEQLVRTMTEPAAAPAAETEEEYPESYARLVEQLEKLFSQQISIKRSKNGGGRIVIEFADDRDIESFLDRFETGTVPTETRSRRP